MTIRINANIRTNASGGATFSFSCTPAGTASTGTSTGTSAHSRNAQTLANNITKSVANTSGVTISNAIGAGIGVGFSNGSAPANFGPGGGFLTFAALERSDTASRTDEAFAALGYAGRSAKTPPKLQRDWNLWADIRGTGWEAKEKTGTGNNLDGKQVNLTAGIGRKLDFDTLVGVVGGYEDFDYDVKRLSGSLSGGGVTVGGYFAHQFGSNLRFDAALAWSSMNYRVTSGTATGSFDGSRWLVITGLTGNQKLGLFTLEPSAKVYVLWERQTAWTDSLGTLNNARSFSSGRTALGSKIMRSWAMSNGWTMSPFVGGYGDWRFSSDDAMTTGAPVANIEDGWSGRVTTGISATAANGTLLSLGGEYGGLGANFKIWSGNISAKVPF